MVTSQHFCTTIHEGFSDTTQTKLQALRRLLCKDLLPPRTRGSLGCGRRFGTRCRSKPESNPTIREQVASGPDARASRIGTRGYTRTGRIETRGHARADPWGPTHHPRAGRVGTRCREQVASGPDAGAGRVGTPGIREQVASGPDTGAGRDPRKHTRSTGQHTGARPVETRKLPWGTRIGTQYRHRNRRVPKKPTIREQVASGPETSRGRAPESPREPQRLPENPREPRPTRRQQVASGPEADPSQGNRIEMNTHIC